MVTSFMDGDEVGTIQLNDFVFGTNPRWVNALWKFLAFLIEFKVFKFVCIQKIIQITIIG